MDEILNFENVDIKGFCNLLKLTMPHTGLNEATIKKYIQEQEKYDLALNKMSVKEYEDPSRDSGR